MVWQILLVFYLVLSVAAQIIQRQLGSHLPRYNREINAVFFIGIHYPLGLVAASIVGYNLNIGWLNLAILFGAGATFPLTNLLAFRASKDVNAGLFSILGNFNPVITIGLAALLLSERLNPGQLFGFALIIMSSLVISIVSYNRGAKNAKKGIVIALASIFLLAIQTVYETWMLSRIGMGSYLVFGLGLQTFWMGILAWPERKKFKKVMNKKYGLSIIGFSLVRSLKGICFVGVVALSSSASIISAFSSFIPVMVVVAGFELLREKKYIRLKIATALAGSVGLVILSVAK